MENIKNKGLVFLLIVVIIFNIFLLNKMNYLLNEIRRINDNILSIESNVRNSVSSGIQDLKDIQQQATSILSEFTYEIGDMKDKRYDITLKAKPKEISDEDKFYFSYKEGENPPKVVEALTNDGITFASAINVSLFKNIELDFIIHRGNTKYRQTLGPIFEPWHKFTAQLSLNPQDGSFKYDNNSESFIFSTSYHMYHYDANNEDISIEIPTYSILKNGEIVEQFDMLKIVDPNRDAPHYEDKYLAEIKNYTLHAIPGDIILLQITTSDTNGLNYKVNVDGWEILENGKFRHLGHDFGMGDYSFMEVIIE